MVCPATGFALGIERILTACERQGISNDVQNKNIYISYDENNFGAAIKKASELRADGKVVEISLIPQNEDDAKKSQVEKNYNELIYLK